MNDLNSKIQACAQKLADELQLTISLPTASEANHPVRVAILGQPTQNLFGVLGEFIDGLEPLNTMILRSYHCTICYGDALEYAICKDGDRFPVTPETLAAKLGEYTAISEMVECEITLESPLLKNLTLELFASSEEFEDIDWFEILSNSHYFLFTLSSTALLAMSERKTLRKNLLPYIGECLGILLTQDHLVPDDAREEIDASLNSFLKGAAKVFRLPETDADAVRDLLDNISGQAAAMEEKRLHRANLLLLRELLKAAEMRVNILSSDTEEQDEAIYALSAKAKLLPSRQESVCRRARMQYIAKLKLEMNEMVSQFHQELMEKLRGEIEASETVDDLPEILPRYVADQWQLMMENIKNRIEEKLVEMNEGLSSYMESDFRDFIQDGMDTKLSEYLFSVVEMYSPKVTDESMFHYQQTRDRTKFKSYGAIASGVALVLMAHPIIGAAVAVFGSKYIRKTGEKQALESNKQALVTAAETMSREAADEAEVMLTQTFASVEAKLAESVEEAYQKMMDMMVQALNRKKQDRANYGEQLEALNTLKQEADQLLAEA